ncbi:unnamed protein product [Sphagnum troendelagicum]
MKQPLNPPVPSFVPVVPLSIRPGGGDSTGGGGMGGKGPGGGGPGEGGPTRARGGRRGRIGRGGAQRVHYAPGSHISSLSSSFYFMPAP